LHNIIKFSLILIIPVLFGCSSKNHINYLDKSYKTDTVTVDLQIPQITGICNDDFRSTVNIEINDTCCEFLNKFKKSAKELSYPAVFTAETKTHQKNGVLSIITQIDYYTEKPHNNSFRITKNINTKESSEIRIKDLFSDDGYIDFINNTLTELAESDADRYSDLWAKPQLSENQTFYITENFLVIYYPPYELSYYTRGFVEFEIPFSSLSGYMTEEYRKMLVEKS